MSVDEAVDLCLQCRKKAPFCSCNGSTLASIVAGVATEKEVRAFQNLCTSLDA